MSKSSHHHEFMNNMKTYSKGKLLLFLVTLMNINKTFTFSTHVFTLVDSTNRDTSAEFSSETLHIRIHRKLHISSNIYRSSETVYSQQIIFHFTVYLMQNINPP